jgi:hypothetical protein
MRGRCFFLATARARKFDEEPDFSGMKSSGDLKYFFRPADFKKPR